MRKLQGPFDPADPHPPARRATDYYIAVTSCAITLTLSITVVRLLARGDVVGATWYAMPAALALWASVCLVKLLYYARRKGRRPVEPAAWWVSDRRR